MITPTQIAEHLGIKSTDVTVINDSGDISVQIVHDITDEQQRKLDLLLDPDAELKAIKKAARMSIDTEQLEPEQLKEVQLIFDEWQPGASVRVGEHYRYRGELYKVIQSHTTQSDWSPDKVPALFNNVAEPGEIPEWKQPAGGHDAYNIGDKVTFNGSVYESLINGNVWSPTAYPAGWKKL